MSAKFIDLIMDLTTYPRQLAEMFAEYLKQKDKDKKEDEWTDYQILLQSNPFILESFSLITMDEYHFRIHLTKELTELYYFLMRNCRKEMDKYRGTPLEEEAFDVLITDFRFELPYLFSSALDQLSVLGDTDIVMDALGKKEEFLKRKEILEIKRTQLLSKEK